MQRIWQVRVGEPFLLSCLLSLDSLLLRGEQGQAPTDQGAGKAAGEEEQVCTPFRPTTASVFSADAVEFTAWQGSMWYAAPGPRSSSSSSLP